MELWYLGGFHEESRSSVRALNAKICHCVSLNFLFLLIYPSHMCTPVGGAAAGGVMHCITIRSEEDGFCERVYKNCKRDPDWQEHMVTHGRVCLQKIYNRWLHMCKTYKICKIIGYYMPGDLHDYHPLSSCAPLCHLSCLCLTLSVKQMQAVKVRGEMLQPSL